MKKKKIGLLPKIVIAIALGIVCDIVMMLLFKAPLIRLLAPKLIAKHPKFWGVEDCIEAVPYFQGVKQAASRKDVRGRFIKLDINLLGLKKIFLTAACCAMVLVAIIVGVRYELRHRVRRRHVGDLPRHGRRYDRAGS